MLPSPVQICFRKIKSLNTIAIVFVMNLEVRYGAVLLFSPYFIFLCGLVRFFCLIEGLSLAAALVT